MSTSSESNSQEKPLANITAIPTAYESAQIEAKWLSAWKSSEVFKANARSKKPSFSLVMPPPNVTGQLHMGHALVNTLQDTLVRYKRMKGFEVLWVPGTDHAGIATQTVVERHLMKMEGKRRSDYTREEFLKRVWDWKNESEGIILSQLRRLGSSCDWSRLAFSMDESRCESVRKAFKILYDKGLIYRGTYLVNWDPISQTALADDEVEYEEETTILVTLRYHFVEPMPEYPLHVCISTTRPETLFADQALAIHPDDPRSKDFVGKYVLIPLTNCKIPIIADYAADPTFGTGILKVTPAHDFLDYEIGARHNLAVVSIINAQGKLVSDLVPKKYQGLTTAEARKLIIEDLAKADAIENTENYQHRVGVSYRSKAIIEPFLSKQWFLKMTAYKDILKEVVEKQEVKLVPSTWDNTYFHWIENLRDWCISRQLWWGHRIPIWYSKKDPSKILCSDEIVPKEVLENPDAWQQDPDVLDTWFSSALWPFSTLGWPHKTEEFAKFFPNSTLITGHDILFFWVARMILMSESLLDVPPFKETFLHGLIYGKTYWKANDDGSIQYLTLDEREKYDLGEPIPSHIHHRWEKMSKSKGNVIDPIEMIDLYGADALRMALCAIATGARQIDLDRRRFEEYKHFINKVWNGMRFILMNIADLDRNAFQNTSLANLDLEDKWILSRLTYTIGEVERNLEEYKFDFASQKAYEFFWNELCSHYLELVKGVLFGKRGGICTKAQKQALLVVLATATLRLLHPMIPFITEELYSVFKEKFTSSDASKNRSNDPLIAECLQALCASFCSTSPFPVFAMKNQEVEKTFDFFSLVLQKIRNLRSEMGIPPQVSMEVTFLCSDPNVLASLEPFFPLLHSLLPIRRLECTKATNTNELSSSAFVDNLQILIPLPSELKEKEKARLIKEREKTIEGINGLLKKLENPEFLERAPKELVAKTKEQMEGLEKKLKEIDDKLELLNR